jgi:hypothetical protein
LRWAGAARPACPKVSPPQLGTTAAHSTLTLADPNSSAILPDGSLGRAVEEGRSPVRDNDASRIEAGMTAIFAASAWSTAAPSALGNDGKEVAGSTAGAQGSQEDPPGRALCHPFSSRQRGRGGADRRWLGRADPFAGAPPWSFRCRGAQLALEESVMVDGSGALRSTLQLVLVGEVSHLGAEIGWQFRRSS